jgi:hypothetical protein
MISLTKQTLSAPAAAEQKTGQRRILMRTAVVGEHEVQILARRAGVSDMKLHRLALPDHVPDCQASGSAVGSNEVPDQEITSIETVAMLIDDDPEMQRPIRDLALFG